MNFYTLEAERFVRWWTARCAVRAAYQRRNRRVINAWGFERLPPADTRAETSQRDVCYLGCRKFLLWIFRNLRVTSAGA